MTGRGSASGFVVRSVGYASGNEVLVFRRRLRNPCFLLYYDRKTKLQRQF